MSETFKPRHVSLIVWCVGLVLYIESLFLPAIVSEDGGGSLTGLDCLGYTMIFPIFWLVIPLIWVNLSFAFSAKYFVVFPNFPVKLTTVGISVVATIAGALLTLVVVKKLQVGYYAWVVSLATISASLIIRRLESTETHKHAG